MYTFWSNDSSGYITERVLIASVLKTRLVVHYWVILVFTPWFTHLSSFTSFAFGLGQCYNCCIKWYLDPPGVGQATQLQPIRAIARFFPDSEHRLKSLEERWMFPEKPWRTSWCLTTEWWWLVGNGWEMHIYSGSHRLLEATNVPVN